MKQLLNTLLLCLIFPFGASAYMININQDNADVLAAGLNGIGTKKAEAIIEYRNKHGLFKSVDDLIYVKGISTKTVEKNRSSISLTPE